MYMHMCEPGRTGQTQGHRKERRGPVTRDRRLVPVCSVVWNGAECIVWNEILEMPALLENLGVKGDLEEREGGGREGGRE